MRFPLLVAAITCLLGCVVTSAAEEVDCGVHRLADGDVRRAHYVQMAHQFCERQIEKGKRFPESPYVTNLYSDGAEVVFVKNPKVMSTSTKFIVYALDNNGEVPEAAPAVKDQPILEKLPTSERIKKLNAYERVAFVRHPYARLYSTWTNKVRDVIGTCPVNEDGSERHCAAIYFNWVNFGKKMLRRLRIPYDENDPGDGILQQITWPVFVEAAMKHAVEEKHFARQVAVMNMCMFNPTFIVAQEHSDDDLQALFDKLAVDHPAAASLSPAQFRANTSKNSTVAALPPQRALKYVNYTELFPPNLRVLVDEYYKDDFAAFGYVTDPRCV